MRLTLQWLLIVGWLTLASRVIAQPAVPPRLSELPRLAATWPPAWAALVADVVPPRADFEKDVLKRVDHLLEVEQPTTKTFRLAQIVLAATLRHHQSLRRTAPLADNPAQTLQLELEDRLTKVRKEWLDHLQKSGDQAEALALIEQWLPSVGREGSLRTAILQAWLHQAKTALEKAEFPAAHGWMIRMEGMSPKAPEAEEIRKPLRARARALLKESQAMPDAAALRMLEEALTLWPQLPEGRDTLERRQGTYKTLRVAVRSLPNQMSPATACTEVEKQTLELLFDRLYRVELAPPLGKRYWPQLATTLPMGDTTASISLRKDAFWSSGQRVSAADVRHTALLMNQTDAPGRSALWRDYLEVPRQEGKSFRYNVGYHRGLFDPLAPLTFWILPETYGDKQLQRAGDPDFARAPLGSGPFQYRKHDAGKAVLFQANPYDLQRGAGSFREIRMQAWQDLPKDLGQPLPHLILDAPTQQLPALQALGYTDKMVRNSTCVHILAVNHRNASLTSAPLRRALAHAIDRQGLLNRHFRSAALKGKYHRPANSLFPHGSWANAPTPRVPDDLFQAEQARSSARKAKDETTKVAWTLKYPAGEAPVQAACEEMARALGALLQEAKIDADIQPIGLTPYALQRALDERDYDLLYTSVESLEDPVRLALFFDRQDEAMRAGGSNYLGCDNLKLHELIRAALQQRQFSAVQESMQTVHVHLHETMPAIPLWHLDMHVLTHPTLWTPPLDPRAVFANVRAWKIAP